MNLIYQGMRNCHGDDTLIRDLDILRDFTPDSPVGQAFETGGHGDKPLETIGAWGAFAWTVQRLSETLEDNAKPRLFCYETDEPIRLASAEEIAESNAALEITLARIAPALPRYREVIIVSGCRCYVE